MGAPHPRVHNYVVLGGTSKFAFLKSFQLLLMLFIQGHILG